MQTDRLAIVRRAHAKQVWESHEGREYARWKRIYTREPRETCLAEGIAVYRGGNLVALGYMPRNHGGGGHEAALYPPSG